MPILNLWFESGEDSLSVRGFSVHEEISKMFEVKIMARSLKPDIDLLDGSLHIPDEQSIEMVYRCLDEEGLYLGASSCLNVAAARDLAVQMGPGHTIVTILCDGAYRYADRLFSRKWLQEKRLLNSIPERLQKYIVLP